jgi:hypothetical protein
MDVRVAQSVSRAMGVGGSPLVNGRTRRAF